MEPVGFKPGDRVMCVDFRNVSQDREVFLKSKRIFEVKENIGSNIIYLKGYGLMWSGSRFRLVPKKKVNLRQLLGDK